MGGENGETGEKKGRRGVEGGGWWVESCKMISLMERKGR